MNRVVTTILLFWAVGTQAQEQFIKPISPTQRQLLNPGFILAYLEPVISMDHLYQDYDGSRPFNTTAINYSRSERRIGGAYGGGVVYDNEASDNRTLKFEGRYAYKLPLSRRTSMAFGVEASLTNRNQRMDRLYDRYNLEQGTAMFQYSVINTTSFNAGAGILFYGSSGYFGLSMSEILPADRLENEQYTMADQPIYSMQTGANFNIGAGDTITKPGVDVFLDMFYQGRPELELKINQFELPYQESLQRGGVMVTAKHRWAYAGVGYTHWVQRMNEVNFLLGYKFFGSWDLSYVFGYGKIYRPVVIEDNFNVFHQISLAWHMPYKPPRTMFFMGTPAF